MAEETNDDKYFSPLDSLGPSYGGINRPSLDIKGFSPFEGAAPLSLPEINFPIVPVAPSFNNLTNTQNYVRENAVGSPGKKVPNKGTNPLDFVRALQAKNEARANTNRDDNEYVKIFAYDPGPSGGNFYKRYTAFGDETFHKLGFHPLRDNEGIYNANTTGWQQSKRMLTHSFIPLLQLGFGSGWDSTVKMFKGDFSANTEDAKAFEEAAAIGYDSRGGIGSFMNNLTLNFGYTAGIIAEAAVEEVAALALEAVSLGTATPAVAAATANNGRKIFNAFRSLDKIDDVGDAMKAVNSSIKAMDNVSNARKFFNAAKVKKVATNFGKFINPVENTYGAIKGIIKNEDNLTGLARVANATKRGFGGFYGDIKAVNMALSEARLEAGMQQNSMYNELYNYQYEKNGNKAPTDEQQKEMMRIAKEAGGSSLFWNTGLIFASNKIVFDNWVGGKGKGPLGFMKSKTEELLNLEGGKVIKTKGSKTLSTGKKFKTSNLEWRKKSFWNTVKSFKDQPLRKSLSGSISYFKSNITEALQENAQEVISEATKNYYMQAYSNPNAAQHIDARGLTMSAIGEQFGTKGFETFASGFFMGMLSSPLNQLKPGLISGYNKIFNKEEFAKYKAARDTAGQNFVKTMSSIPLEEFFNSKIFDYGSQSDAHETRMSGTEKDARDASDAAFIFKMGSVMQNNMTDFYKGNLQSLSELTADEIEEVIPSIPKGEGQKYLDKLPSIIEKMNKIENRYKAVNERFPNPINLADLDKDDADYDDAVLLHKSWEIGKQNAVFMSESFDDTMNRMASITNDLISNGPIKKGSYNNIKVLFDQPLLKNELDMLKTQAETLQGLKGSEEELAKTKKKITALEKLNESLSKFRNYYDVSERARIKETIKEKNPELSQEDIDRVVDEELGIRTAEEDKIKTEDFKKAYAEYIRTIGNLEGETVFDSTIDDSFEKLKDYYLLSSESKRLADYVNLLHDPQGFYEHIQRNKAWMKELYDNRSEYYENLKEHQFQKNETNDLLNHLASRNLYISFDDLEKWLTAGILPEEIFDDTNKTVIKKSNPMYNDIIQPFLMLKEIQSKKSEAEIIKDSVKAQLDALEQTKAERIKALPVEEKRIEKGEILIKRSTTYKKLAKEMQDGDYVDAVTKENEAFTFYKDGDVLKYENKDGEPVTDDNLGKQKFVTANLYRITNEPDPVEVKKINDEFEALKAEVIARAVNNGVEDPEDNEPKVYSTDTPLDKLPQDLFNDLSIAFANQYTEENGEMDLTKDDFYVALESFVKSDFLAARIIDDYNKEQEIKQATEVTTDQTPDIKIVINNTPVPLDELEESDIRGFLRTFEAELKALEEKADKTPEDNTKISKLKYNIKGIKKFLEKQVRAGFSAEQKKTIDILEKLIKKQGDILKTPNGYVVNGQAMQRVTNVIKEFVPEYKYTDELAVRATFATTIGEQGFTVNSIKNFIQQLRKQNLGGFSEFTYTELESDLNAILAEPAIAIDESVAKTALEGLKEDLKSAEGEFKNEELAAQIRAQIAELEKKVTTAAPTEDIKAKTAEIEKEREEKVKEFLRNVKNNKGEKSFEDPNLQDQLEIKQYSRNVAKALAEGQPITFEFLKANLGARFTTNSSNVIIVDFNRSTNKIDLLEEGTVRRISIDKNNNIDYDFEGRGKQIDLKKSRPISLAEGTYQKELKEINAKYDTELADLEAPVSNKKADIESKIKSIESQISTLSNFIAGTDSYAATVSAQRDIKNYREEIKQLKKELADLEGGKEVSTAEPKLGFQTFNIPVSKKEDIANVVAGPLLPASEIFWDKNIRTTGSWLNSIQGEASGGQDYIEIAFDSLSEENKKIANKLKDSDTNFGGVKGVRIVLGNNLNPQDAQRKAIEVANKFKQQDLLWYSPTTLEDRIDTLEKQRNPRTSEAVDQEIQRVKDTWGLELKPGEYFDTATKTIWASKELYNKSKGLSTLEGAKPETQVSVEDRKAKLLKELKDIAGQPQSTPKSRQRTKEIQDELASLEAQPKQATAAGATLLDRILKIVSEKTYKASTDAGNYMDKQIRNLLDNVDPVFEEKKITQKAFDEAFRADDENPGYIRRIKDIIDKEGLYVLSRVMLEDGTERGFVVYDEEAGIAGEIDLLAVDRLGKLHIIDIKTGQASKWDGFNDMVKGYSKKDNYTLQQLAYSNLLFNMTGMDSKISLLPIQLSYNSQTGIISKVGKPTAKDLLKPGTYRIALTPSEQIKANIESKIPRKGEVVSTPATEPANTAGQDYEFEEEPIDENLPEEPPVESPIEGLRNFVKDATQEQLDSLKSELSIAIAKNMYSAADIIAIQEVLDERQRELESNVQIKLTSNNVKVNDQLIANVGIFTGKDNSEVFAQEGGDVVVTKIDSGNNTVTLKSLSNGKPKSFTFAELNKMFILKQTVMAFEEEEKEAAPLTKVEKNFVSESIDNVNELLRSNERKEALKKEAAQETMDDIDTELFDDDSSNC